MTIKQIVFDFGGVIVEWAPQRIARMFSTDAEVRKQILNEILQHSDWLKLDRGDFSELDAINHIVSRSGLTEKTINAVFETVRRSFTPLTKTVQVLQALNDKNIACYGLTNMSFENYTYLREKFDFFDYFNGIIVSGIEHVIKPDVKIYELLCQRYNLKPSETLFIDDMTINCKAAALLGMRTIVFDRKEFDLSLLEMYLTEN
jgi:putative hydrolase of the HAD superfamily